MLSRCCVINNMVETTLFACIHQSQIKRTLVNHRCWPQKLIPDYICKKVKSGQITAHVPGLNPGVWSPALRILQLNHEVLRCILLNSDCHSDPQECFQLLYNSTLNTVCEPFFLSILQHLLTIRDDVTVRFVSSLQHFFDMDVSCFT